MYYHRVRVVAGGCLLRRRLNMVGSCFYRGAATIFLTHHAISSNHHALPFCHVLAFINRFIGTITYSLNLSTALWPLHVFWPLYLSLSTLRNIIVALFHLKRFDKAGSTEVLWRSIIAHL